MIPAAKLPIASILARAADHRLSLVTEAHNSAFRLFNGFYEGHIGLVADVYAKTLVITSFEKKPTQTDVLIDQIVDFYTTRFPWIECAIIKLHHHAEQERKRGVVVAGGPPDRMIEENGVRYALDLCINQDSGFYLDTRSLRKWIKENSLGRQVLNAFAYTGSLGVAALAGGAARVLQMDRNVRFLETSHTSAVLNDIKKDINKILVEDFFVGVARLKKSGQLVDLVFLDPPYFSVTEKGRVDQAKESHRLINKVRPLVKDGGRIVAVNNSLFLSGKEYLRTIEQLSEDGFVSLEEIIPVPEDMTGYPDTVLSRPPCDPAPFNHPTKIAILKVRRKTSPGPLAGT